ncbi:hypothetical protein, partial [Sulfuricurvum sp.]|uniref:hypothetical protein n=1 Tax=Sulfuricurvum sp. TaxID=2025608 RepID=UPI002E5D85EA|nr:hypothetical protein [Sulfuricurvum sp.]
MFFGNKTTVEDVAPLHAKIAELEKSNQSLQNELTQLKVENATFKNNAVLSELISSLTESLLNACQSDLTLLQKDLAENVSQLEEIEALNKDNRENAVGI